MNAFVFGKFLPFHNGHRAMINFALLRCELLYVVVCASDRENIDGQTRCNWIAASTDPQRVKCVVFEYNESELPNTSVPSQSASRMWGECFKKLVPECGLLISSEDYGPMVAEHMNIQHLYFDKERLNINISASKIRANLYSCWNYLPATVKSHFAIKVAVSGTESTGKSTLVNNIAAAIPCSTVAEVGREVIPHTNNVSYPSLVETAIRHAEEIRRASSGQHPLIIADTDLRVTQSYCRFLLKTELLVEDWIKDLNDFDLYLYLNTDAPFIQDGTRMTEAGRNTLDQSHRSMYEAQNLPLVELHGSWDQKFKTTIERINKLVQEKSNIKWRE